MPEWEWIYSLLNLFHTRGIETIEYIFFHLAHRLCVWGEPVMVLRKTPVLFNEIQFRVKLWVKIANVSATSDKFFQLRLLSNKVWLIEEKTVTTR